MADEPKIRGGYLFTIDDGIGCANPSLKNRTNVSTKFVELGQLGFNKRKYYGDKLTWWELAGFSLAWGHSDSLLFPALAAGWEYKYDVLLRVFSVIDDNDAVIYQIQTDDIADFGVSWDVFESHQFYFYIGGRGFIPPFLPASRNKERDGIVKEDAWWADFIDEYLADAAHHYRRQCLADTAPWIEIANGNGETQIINIAPIPEVLHPIPLRTALGDYSTYMLEYDEKEREAEREKERDGLLNTVDSILLSVVFAITAYRGKPVYEPWMLWNIWKWLAKATPRPNRITIFDIAPNWG